MPRPSNAQLIELCAIPYCQLSPGQRKSARTYKRRTMNSEAMSMEAERLLDDQPQLSVTKAYYAVMSLAETSVIGPIPIKPASETGRKVLENPSGPEPLEPSSAVSPASPVDAGDDPLVRFLDGWPDDIVQASPFCSGRWTRAARVLKDHADRGPAVIAENLTRRRAFELRRLIRQGRCHAFAPAGSFVCEIAYDHSHEDRYLIVARFAGKPGE